MSGAVPPTKRQRIDPNALDDPPLPADGQTILGKRQRKTDNKCYANVQGITLKTQSAPSDHPNAQSNSNTSAKNDDPQTTAERKETDDTVMSDQPNDDNNSSNEHNNSNLNTHPRAPINFEKGKSVDVQIKDEFQDDYWASATICRVLDEKVLVHISRVKSMWIQKDDVNIAPPGTHTEGLN